MTQQEAEDRIQEFLKAKPTLSVIPKDTPTSELVVRHGGYDTGGVLKDHNVAFPLETLKQLEEREVIGAVAARVYSFVGACAQGVLKKMVAEKWVEEVKRQGADAVLLVPV